MNLVTASERSAAQSKDLLFLLYLFLLVILSVVEGPAFVFLRPFPTHKSPVPHPLRVLCEMGGIPQSSTIHALKGRGFNRAATPHPFFRNQSTRRESRLNLAYSSVHEERRLTGSEADDMPVETVLACWQLRKRED
jgi:hypothetical protein